MSSARVPFTLWSGLGLFLIIRADDRVRPNDPRRRVLNYVSPARLVTAKTPYEAATRYGLGL